MNSVSKLLIATLSLAAGSLWLNMARAASFDCAKARTKVEKLICADPFISKLDGQLGKVYDKDLAKANPKQKKQLMRNERYWLKDMRDLCTTQTCFKQAYWERLAELETFYLPHSPLYAKASDKAPIIQNILKTKRFYVQGSSYPKMCRHLFDAVKEMKGIRYVNPIVQTMSYSSPALESLRRKVAKQCKAEFPQNAPINFSYSCDPTDLAAAGYNINVKYTNLDTNKKTDGLKLCDVHYGLPPFKLFRLNPVKSSGKARYLFYSDSAYGPMNSVSHKPIYGVTGGGFSQILPGCGRRNNYANGWPDIGGVGSQNYSSIIKYKDKYYYLLLTYGFGSYSLSINPVAQKAACSWTSLKPSMSNSGSK